MKLPTTASTSHVLYMVVDHQSEIVGARADCSFSSRDDISARHFSNRSGSAGLELAFPVSFGTESMSPPSSLSPQNDRYDGMDEYLNVWRSATLKL